MLVLSGVPGCGKTYLCAALIQWMFGKVRDIYGMKEADFFERIRASFEMKGDYHQEIEYQCDHEFFIYDDMGSTGKGGETGWRKEVIFELLNIRYESKNPTVITTNFTRKQVNDILGERTYSRLYSKENCVIEMFDYPDLRCPGAMN
jgi:DNA replication protein DnaC